MIKRCQQCKREFETTRRESLTCGDVCRKRRQRDRGALHRSYVAMMRELSSLNRIAKRRTIDPSDFRGFAESIRLELTQLLLIAGDKDTASMIAMLNDREV